VQKLFELFRNLRSYAKYRNRVTGQIWGKYFSLNSIDKKLEKFLPEKNLYFVELGANDGVSQSNTKYFEMYKKWHGILIEPYEPNYRKCRRNRSSRSHVVHAACVSSNFLAPTIKLMYSNLMTIALEGLNDIGNREAHAESGRKFYIQNADEKEFLAPARTLNSILQACQAPKKIDFLSLDVEGGEIEVLKGLDLNEFQFRYICVETRSFDTIREILFENGYSLVEKLTNHDYLFEYSKGIQNDEGIQE
jgi:FkbM family methyltransferase